MISLYTRSSSSSSIVGISMLARLCNKQMHFLDPRQIMQLFAQ